MAGICERMNWNNRQTGEKQQQVKIITGIDDIFYTYRDNFKCKNIKFIQIYSKFEIQIMNSYAIVACTHLKKIRTC